MDDVSCLDRCFLGDMGMLLQCLHYTYLKNSGATGTHSCTQKFSRGFLDIVRIKMRHLKGENKCESYGRLNSNGLDTEGLKLKLLKGTNCLFQYRI